MSARSLASLTLLASLLGCSTASRSDGSSVPSADKPSSPADARGPLEYEAWLAEVPSDTTRGGHALLWYDAELFAAPEPTALRSRRLEPAERYVTMTNRFPVAVVQEIGDFVEVRSLGDIEQSTHCGFEGAAGGYAAISGRPRGPTFGGYDLRMFVRRQDMVPVLGSQYADSNEDGSSVLLAAGTPIEPHGRSLGVRIGRLWFPIYTQPADLKFSYDAAPVSSAEGGLPDRCDDSATGRLLGEEVSLADVAGRWVLPCSIEQRDDDPGLRVILQDRCARLEVAVSEDPRPTHGSGGGGMLHADEANVETWTLPQGVKALWRDGTPAGTKRTTQTTRVPPEVVGTLSCWSFGDDFDLCHESGDVQHEPAQSPPL